MTKKDLAKKYIEHLAAGDIKAIINLFAANGKVHSPIYGEMKAAQFYKTLSEDTSQSALTLKGIFEDTDSDRLAIYFGYTWTIKSGETVVFDVVDIINFDHQYKIVFLKIIYDTVISRRLIAEMKK